LQQQFPFTVGGGISSVADVEVLLQNGADKVSINSSAIKNPQLINDLASKPMRCCSD
jgi:cyclase